MGVNSYGLYTVIMFVESTWQVLVQSIYYKMFSFTRIYRSSTGLSPLGHTSRNGQPPGGTSGHVLSRSAEEEELELALALSRQLSLEEERRRRHEQEEEEELQRVLKLSLQDK